MNTKGIICSAFVGVASLLPVSCYRQEVKEFLHNRENLLEEVMLDRPQVELNTIKSNLSCGAAKYAETQHNIDSIVFRDMFLGSQLVEDSNFITDYNKMMTKTKTPTYITGYNCLPAADNSKIEDMLTEKLTVREMKNVMKSSVLEENGGKGCLGIDRQYILDSVYHHKLFEKYNLLDKNGLKKFKDLCRKVRP